MDEESLAIQAAAERAVGKAVKKVLPPKVTTSADLIGYVAIAAYSAHLGRIADPDEQAFAAALDHYGHLICEFEDTESPVGTFELIAARQHVIDLYRKSRITDETGTEDLPRVKQFV